MNKEKYRKILNDKNYAKVTGFIYFLAFCFGVVMFIISLILNLFYNTETNHLFYISLIIICLITFLLAKTAEINCGLKLEILKLGGKLK